MSTRRYSRGDNASFSRRQSTGQFFGADLNNFKNRGIVKLSSKNRRRFTKISLFFSFLSLTFILIAISTDHWLYTSEWLKYYNQENATADLLLDSTSTKFYKNATFGCWYWCWEDPATEFSCHKVVQFAFDDDFSDTTTAVEISLRKVVPSLILSVVLVLLALILSIPCAVKRRVFRLIQVCGVIHVISGMSILLCLILFVHGVTGEVGTKEFPRDLEDPLFVYHYGFSFVFLVLSYLSTELAAVFILIVFMAKQEEKMCRNYHVHSLFTFMKDIELTDQTRQLVHLEGCHVVSRRAYRRIVFERRLMLISILCCSLAVLVFVVAVATISWAFVEVIQPNNASFVLQLGVWGEFRTDYDANKIEIQTTWIRHFPRPPEDRPRLKDQDLPHYHRAQAVLSSMAIGLMILSIYVAVCSLKYHRYMYKRLAAGVMFLSAMCVLSTIQILIYSIEEWSAYSDDHKNVDYVGATKYGISTTLAYVAVVTFFVSSIIFLIGGRKHKGLMAATQEFEVEDRPVNLGRKGYTIGLE